MTDRSRTLMADALRATRSGQLGEATALIREALTGATAAQPMRRAAPARRAVEPSPVPLPRTLPTIDHAPPGSAPGLFDERVHIGSAARLDYRLYRPADATAAMPLVVMLHGCTQSAEDFARGTAMNRLADEQGFIVAYPNQTQAANAQRCWNWFRPGDQQRDRGEPALIAGMTRDIVAAEAVDPARIYIAGLSAGGAAAAIMAAAYPDLYAAVGIHSGLAPGAARNLPGALMAMRRGAVGGTRGGIPVITFHGDRDKIVAEANSGAIVTGAQATGGDLHLTSRIGRSAGGRDYTVEVAQDPSGRVLTERWTIHGAGHAWSGGDAAGTYTDPAGPDASREMLRFFRDHGVRAG